MNLHDCEVLIAEALHPQAGAKVLQQASGLLCRHPRMTPDAQLLIYRHNISGGFINALSGTFSTCEIILGKACFATLARDYAWNQTHQHGDLNRLGEAFPDFIEGILASRGEFSDYGYLADLARLEWLIEKAYQAEDSARTGLLNENALEKYAQDKLYLVVNPSLQLLDTDYPVYDIWRMHTQEDTPSQVQGLETRDHLCLCRDHDDDVIISHISRALFKILFAGRTQQSLQSMTNDSPFEVLAELVQAIHNGWVIGFRYKE